MSREPEIIECDQGCGATVVVPDEAYYTDDEWDSMIVKEMYGWHVHSLAGWSCKKCHDGWLAANMPYPLQRPPKKVSS